MAPARQRSYLPGMATPRPFQLLRHLPTTKLRITVSVLLSVVVVVGHICFGVQPAGEVLLFLAGMAGIDVAQYRVRRSMGSPPEST